MKSEYLCSAADLEVGDRVIVDGYADQPVTLIGLNQIFARCKTDEGYEWSVVRNRVEKAMVLVGSEGCHRKYTARNLCKPHLQQVLANERASCGGEIVEVEK